MKIKIENCAECPYFMKNYDKGIVGCDKTKLWVVKNSNGVHRLKRTCPDRLKTELIILHLGFIVILFACSLIFVLLNG